MHRLRAWLDPGARSSMAIGIATAVLVVTGCTLLIFPLKRLMPVSPLDALYIPGILLVASKWGAPLGVLCALAAAFSFDYFHVQPVAQFTRLLPSDAVVFVTVSAAAILVANLSQRTRSAEELRQLESASRARVVTAADEERRRVVRDLHDGAQQRLVHAVIVLQLARRELGGADSEAAELVEEALRHAEQANHELRELVHGILPSALTRGGLHEGVAALVPRLTVPVTVEVTRERFPVAVEATAYFIVSEALTNVVKHARAKGATVTARVGPGVLNVEIRDDGVGGASIEGTGGLGGLEDRVSSLNGRLVVDSPRGGGTRVLARLPLEDQGGESPK